MRRPAAVTASLITFIGLGLIGCKDAAAPAPAALPVGAEDDAPGSSRDRLVLVPKR